MSTVNEIRTDTIKRTEPTDSGAKAPQLNEEELKDSIYQQRRV